MTSSEATNSSARLRERNITFDNGSTGRNLEIPSATPLNYHQVISNPDAMPTLTVDGKLFLPPVEKRQGAGRLPLIMVVPGSLGVTETSLEHAQTFTDMGAAAFVLDSFSERKVTSTVANQTQFSFAASAYDVLAAWKVLASLPEIDATRIGAQGHSRGGSAVLTSATRRFADAVVGSKEGLCSVLAAYPWSGHQFLDPRVGKTEVHVLMGDADEWCSPMQVQAHCHAIRCSAGAATMRLVGRAQHSFDRGTPVVNIPEAKVSPGAPIGFITDDGAFLHPLEDVSNPDLVDRDLMVYALKAGFGRTGARLGSAAGEAELFQRDMTSFWRRVLALG